MKAMRLVDRIQKLLERPHQDVSLKKLRKTVKALKQKQEDLEERLKRTRRKHSRRKLQKKIELLRAQRKQGAEAYRRLAALARKN
jgi:predicted ATP-grasp superfamily ATP-dependent carboligase